MIRRPPRSTPLYSSAASDVYKRQVIFLLLSSKAQVYYVSSSQGSDMNNGLSSQTPFQSIEKLNSMQFSAGDSIYFKSGDYWEGMFWLNGSGSLNQPIVIDIYGGSNRAIINGVGYQSSILIFNDTATTEIYTSLFVGSVRCV